MDVDAWRTEDEDVYANDLMDKIGKYCDDYGIMREISYIVYDSEYMLLVSMYKPIFVFNKNNHVF